MTESITIEQTLGLVRHILTIIGVALVSANTIAESQWTVITGSLMAIVPIIWSLWIKRPAALQANANAILEKRSLLKG